MLEMLLEIILWAVISGILIVLLVEENGQSRFSGRIRTSKDWQLIFSCTAITVGCWLIIIPLFHNAKMLEGVYDLEGVLKIIGGKFVLGLLLAILGIVIDFLWDVCKFPAGNN